MPEGDLVWYTARRLHEALAGRVLTRSDFRVPRYATVNLAGQAVSEVVSRGKHLLIRTGGGLTIHTHLKMEGSWRVRPAAEPLADTYKIRLLLANSEWQAAGYSLGITEVLPTSKEHRVTGHLGPDLLGPDWDAGQAAARLAARPGCPIGEALLDQRNLAGIGTWYAAEMLFLRGVNPWRPAGEVDDLDALAALGYRLLEENKARAGHTSTGDTRRGQDSWVYGRAGRPCRRCGTPIRRGEQGPPGQERLRFWCPNCQKLGPAWTAALVDASVSAYRESSGLLATMRRRLRRCIVGPCPEPVPGWVACPPRRRASSAADMSWPTPGRSWRPGAWSAWSGRAAWARLASRGVLPRG